MKSFSAKIEIIGVNPYVLLPQILLKEIFQKAGKDKGPIAIQLAIAGKDFIQNLVKYSGKWRLYLNTPSERLLVSMLVNHLSVRQNHRVLFTQVAFQFWA